MLQHVKTCKKSIWKFYFPVKLYETWKKVIIQNYFLHKDLQIWIATFFHTMYIFLFNLKKYYWKSKIQFCLTIICEIRKKRKNAKLFVSIRSTNFVSHTVPDKTYIFRFNFKNTIKIQKFHLFEKIWEIKKTFRWKIICLNGVY